MVTRTILHADMDAFYASVEVLLDPSLAGKPVIVGGSGARGVVASCSYEARAYGIRSAMPSVRARRLCPHAVFLPGHHGIYADYSRRIHEVFATFTPLIEGIALDEAFLDVTAAKRLFGDGARIAAAVRDAVKVRVGLSCAVGVATSKLIAKLASKSAKPELTMNSGDQEGRPLRGPAPIVGARRVSEGVVVVDPGRELEFLHPLPARALWGIGPATFARLARFGVVTVGDLAALPESAVVAALGQAGGRHLHALSWGRDDRPVEPERPVKSIGHEETFEVDHRDMQVLGVEVLRMSDSVASRLRSAGVKGRTLQLKLRFGDFRTITRSRTLSDPVDTAPVIAATAKSLLGDADLHADIQLLGVRLLGVSMANFAETAGTQLDLFAGMAGDAPCPVEAVLDDLRPPPSGRADARALAEALDAIRGRFGAGSVGPAALVDSGRLRVKRTGDTQWGPSSS